MERTLALCLLLAAAPAAAHPAPQLRVDPTPIQRPATPAFSFAPVIAKVAPAVVNVTVEQSHPKEAGQGEIQQQLLRKFFGQNFDIPLPEQQPEGPAQGSGVIVSPDGYILTNNHVAAAGDVITVTIPSRTGDFKAKVIGRDPQTDVAVLKIDASDLPTAVFADSSKLEIGDVAMAIGNPFGLGQTVTMGIVSAVGRGNIGIEDYEDFIQTDAAINPGNSGGALIDAQGRLIGINTAILSPSGGNLGIGFAVPANMARAVLDALVERGRVVRGYLGAMIQDLTPGMARRFDVREGRGALVGDVAKEGPGEKAGLKAGDVIVELDGKPVRDARTLRLAVAQKKPGTKVTLTLVRDGKRQPLDVTLGELPQKEEETAEQGGPPERNPLEGASLEDISPDIAEQLDLPRGLKGAVVAQVEPGSRPFRAGLRPGDVIVEVERRKVETAEQALSALRRARGDALLRVWSRGSYHFVLLPKATA